MGGLSMRPRLAVVPGDPSGIGPELIARLLAMPAVLPMADVLLVGDAHLWRRGAEQAQVPLRLETIDAHRVPGFRGLKHLDLDTSRPEEVRTAEVAAASGASSLRCLDRAMDLALAGDVDGILFAPFNKAAMTRAGLDAEDEHAYMARYLGFDGHHGEINVLDEFMTTRVTSHIALKDVAAGIDRAGVVRAVELAHATLAQAGRRRPHVAVAALNPHAGDGGKFGREEIEILAPAVEDCRRRQMNVTGPWPSDTVFLKARDGEVDAVVTMYHDQGQIAVKLLGFERGVTVAGGLPVPVATPAHGTAFDIAGRGRADPGATRKAFELLVRLARTHRRARESAGA